MKYFIFPIVFICLLSCNEAKRDFFQNLKAKNIFLDTFSLSNLKGVGLSAEPTIKQEGKSYYDFNIPKNSIYTNGLFCKVKDKLFFLPNGADREFLFLDLRWNTLSTIAPQSLTTESQSFYSTEWLGLSYNAALRDSVYNVKINSNNIFNRSEDLLFEISKKLELISIEQINCKHDTLTINFFPKQEVYFKHINKNAVCL